MRNFLLAIRSLQKKGQHNEMKIISLSIGLAVGLLLVAKVCFEYSYDDFYPDKERIYKVYEKFTQNQKDVEYGKTPGGVAVALREMMPEIETATRMTGLTESTFTLTEDKRRLNATFTLADSCWFDVLSRPQVAGDLKESLSRPLYAAISRSLAEKIGGNVIGRNFTIDSEKEVVLTIGGVFEDYPENGTIHSDVFISLASIGNFMWDGSMNFLGNDRYHSFIKLKSHTDIAAVEQQQDAFFRQYVPEVYDTIQKMQFALRFYPLEEIHKSDPQVKKMTLMLSLIAFALLFTASMNYVLIVVSSLINRAKEIAVRKSYGATRWNIQQILLSEAFVHLLLSVAFAVLLLLAFREVVADLIGVSLWTLLQNGWPVILLVCLLILLVSGLFPGTMFARIPVSAAFRNYRENKRLWKLSLLFMQFVAAAFLISLLPIVGRQYHKMVHADPGYQYENLFYADMKVLQDTTKRRLVIEELKRLPEVAGVAYAVGMPVWGLGGNNILLPGEDEEMFNINDLYYVSPNYVEMMGIRLLEGRTFNPNLRADEEVLISRRTAEQLKLYTDWGDDLVGKSICVTAHNGDGKSQVICGIYEDVCVGSLIGNETPKGSVLFSVPIPMPFLMIRFHQPSSEVIAKAEAVLKSVAPDQEIPVYSYADEIEVLYQDTRKFRDSVLIGGVVTLAIVIIGLVGYTADEANRRRKEMALRKINGAMLRDILRLFMTDILRVACPGVLLGCMLSYLVAQNWQQQYADKIPLSWYYYAGSVVFILLLVSFVSVYQISRISAENPVKSIRLE